MRIFSPPNQQAMANDISVSENIEIRAGAINYFLVPHPEVGSFYTASMCR